MAIFGEIFIELKNNLKDLVNLHDWGCSWLNVLTVIILVPWKPIPPTSEDFYRT